ncbi:cytosine permease [Dehalogenimonas sp. 4OHTPN]|uniref:Cytosine permease n=1 Tax=Dehalogenimonas sp. 4OHTPN TaxID=3166643 RepID=A0AAU8GBV6_9CHLR
MNGYPVEYNSYQPMFWQAAFSAVIGVAMMIALGAWALSTVRKALKGEDVEFPL